MLNILMFLSKGQCDHNMYVWLCVNVCGSAVEDGCRNEEKLVKRPAISIRIYSALLCVYQSYDILLFFVCR
jgi:hypothetical protein